MLSRRDRSAPGYNGNSCKSNFSENRSFPRFQPMEHNNRDNCPPPKKVSAPAPPKYCTRTHSLNQGQEERKVCCSAHPEASSCCSARPAVIPPEQRQATSNSGGKLRPYKLPYPLGGSNCGRSVPLASLIYREPEGDFGEGEEGFVGTTEEGNEANTATHSCPLSSASPEPRSRCCRRPSGGQPVLPMQLQVLLQDTKPTNANQTSAKSQDPRRRRASKVRKASKTAMEKLKQRKSYKARPAKYEAPPMPPHPSSSSPPQRLQQQHQRQRRKSMDALTAHRTSLSRPRGPKYQPNQGYQFQKSKNCMPEQSPQQQPQQQLQEHPQVQRQENQHQHQHQLTPTYLIENVRSHSQQSELCNDEIYSTCNMECDDEDTWPDQDSLPQAPQPLQPEQHIHRKSFAKMLRTPEYPTHQNQHNRSSSASEI